MNKIVREHYPVERLPEDLCQGLDIGSAVTVTIIEEAVPSERVMTLEEIFAARKPPFRSPEEIDTSLRTSRNEWERRG